MKLLTFILSFYFLALNVVPCSDMEPLADGQVSVVADSGDGYGHALNDLCSPFCHCHCCHTHTVSFEIFSFEPFQPSIPQEELAHFDSLGKDISLDLLQPPRV
ncbi:hypothetical protein Q4603_12720 [Zobellia galactanivorans]|uniref:DUF6660 family protein n=1 Tax=Zobellia galactanivorans (strain DSM 12802 / CCUG 47099 / CIP 106680 / NCIMB 13871 / Dsij) TaxID=63186 RepID=UPI0026E3C03C|nr:DUF6660 family protein [Zobellia galactanivorans]MDO6809484.1 hypothetical protein [Zobellia galactanivorans]